MRLIDADRLITRLRKDPLFCLVEPYGIIGVIEAEHTVDAVEVVRCKDCKWWQDNNAGYPSEYCKWDKDETPDYDDFCSMGERREDATD